MIIGNTLIVGAGPADIQTSQIIAPFSPKIALINKISPQWKKKKDEHGNVASCEVSKPPLVSLVRFDELYYRLISPALFLEYISPQCVNTFQDEIKRKRASPNPIMSCLMIEKHLRKSEYSNRYLR